MKVNPDDFTNCAWQGIIDAKDLALTEKHQTLETEHLFWSLLKKNEIAIKIIERSGGVIKNLCLLYTSPSPRDGLLSRMPSSA